MKFVTNTISTKTKVTTLAEMYKAAQTKAAMSKSASAKPQVTKTASKAEAVEEIEIPIEVKTAGGNIANFGDKKAKPFGQKGEDKKDDKKSDKKTNPFEKKDKKKDEKEEVEEKKASKSVAKSTKKAEKGESDEADSSGQLKVEPLHQNGESTGEKPGDLDTQKDGKEGKASGGKKKDCEEGESSGQPEAEAKLVNEPKVDKSSAVKAKKLAHKKIAELTGSEKEFLRGVWSNFWPKAFIDAILAPQ